MHNKIIKEKRAKGEKKQGMFITCNIIIYEEIFEGHKVCGFYCELAKHKN